MPTSASIPAPVPTKNEILAVLPENSFDTNLLTSLSYAAVSVTLTVGSGLLAWQLIPLQWAWLPVWLLYALVTGTFACGVWVIAHECGHGAFCKNKPLQDTIGFVLHSSVLVPYFSWQRSHAIHHAKTNHLVDGETHVPKRVDMPSGAGALALRQRLGHRVHALLSLLGRLFFGWPLYLLLGATGGSERGTTNHFWPYAPFSKALFPQRWARKVLASSVGVLTVIGLLVWWSVAAGSPVPALAVYGGPYLVCHAWLVTYTWLQHTNADTPHFEDDEWSYVRGAFCSIDRPYGRVFDFLHHRIGSTHVAHHLFARIPHYRAEAATVAIREAFGEHYRYDPTPIVRAAWRASNECVAVAPHEDGWRYVNEPVNA